MKPFSDIKTNLNVKRTEFSLTRGLTFGVIDESNIDADVLDEAAHANKPCEISSLAWNMENNAFIRHKKNQKSQKYDDQSHMRSLDAGISTKHSVNKSILSGEYNSFTAWNKKTLKMEVKQLLHALVVINKKKTNALMRFNSSNYSIENNLVNVSRRIESEVDK